MHDMHTQTVHQPEMPFFLIFQEFLIFTNLNPQLERCIVEVIVVSRVRMLSQLLAA